MVHFGNRDARVSGIGQVEGAVVEVAPPGVVNDHRSGGHVAGTGSGILLTLHLPTFRTILITIANNDDGAVRNSILCNEVCCNELAEVGSGRGNGLVKPFSAVGAVGRKVVCILKISKIQFRVIIQLVAGRRKDSVRIGQGLGRLRNEHGELLDDLIHLGIGHTGLAHIQVKGTLVESLVTNYPPGVIYLGNLHGSTVGTGGVLFASFPAFRTITKVSAHGHDHGAVRNLTLGNNVRSNEFIEVSAAGRCLQLVIIGRCSRLIPGVLGIPEREFLVIGGVLAGFGQDFLNGLRIIVGFRNIRSRLLELQADVSVIGVELIDHIVVSFCIGAGRIFSLEDIHADTQNIGRTGIAGRGKLLGNLGTAIGKGYQIIRLEPQPFIIRRTQVRVAESPRLGKRTGRGTGAHTGQESDILVFARQVGVLLSLAAIQEHAQFD